jgi:hypothetical protein
MPRPFLVELMQVYLERRLRVRRFGGAWRAVFHVTAQTAYPSAQAGDGGLQVVPVAAGAQIPRVADIAASGYGVRAYIG